MKDLYKMINRLRIVSKISKRGMYNKFKRTKNGWK